jgi:HD superfamily phosphodiesterase
MYSREPIGPEALYLHDADALDWLGAIGAARLFALVDPAGGKPTGQDAAAALRRYLKDVPGRILSPAGRAAAVTRTLELERFLQALASETDNLTAL